MVFIQHPKLSLAIYEFTQGAKEAAKFASVNIIVDTFRVSNVAIALLEVGVKAFPANSFEEGQIEVKLMREGKFTGIADIMIAGTMKSHGIGTIVTRNVKHFEKIGGIKVITWNR